MAPCPRHGRTDLPNTAIPSCGIVKVKANGESKSEPQAVEAEAKSGEDDQPLDEDGEDTLTTVACTMAAGGQRGTC